MTRNTRKLLLWIPALAFLAFIFHNSLIPATRSDQESFTVTYWILNHLQHLGLCAKDLHAFHHVVRKLAHFSEYAGLAFLVCIALYLAPLMKRKKLNFTLFWLIPPIIDELLQKITPGRSCQISDMLLDAAGFLFGAFVFYLIHLILWDLRNRIAKPL